MKSFFAADLERRVLAGSLADGVNAGVANAATVGRARARRARMGRPRIASAGAHLRRTARQRLRASPYLLRARGVGRGDVVAGLLPRIPELLTVILGAWRAGAIYQPLFTAFGPAAIESRVTAPGGSKAKSIVTDLANRAKLDGVRTALPC